MGKRRNKLKKNVHNNVDNKQLNNKPSLKWRLINKEANFFDKVFEENLINFQKMTLSNDDNSLLKEDTIEEKITRTFKKIKKKRRKKKTKTQMRKRTFQKQKKKKFKR
ncbi:conserved Plasmodium protein, unknown function [Plasmodium berghei]|uniref:Uncharacterized protein n=2 Tax=Plasmodium berghei TaxID=5821 RepID=A0A509ANN9_PLABA|nr:conserved Plasmodium protein, unknown function [Plasmodium berghei ANKA]CXI82062.1 conserved Plasmodium protein, unknown function [Plasmodium berghei]SCM25580.1 conserved Plasmodium protein, unknown function [Plasmodium berghei]SCN27410.1 conserved Plasmodium protein, unknown function [Plasmodium berghei]SCO62090.1 conserved Plasmodium protein, unknown function [Plasmodium berghei]SCO63837.1 conserved Plasmodium protein, unknown function [Plasmodium berghei]|eukprot:XP_034423042.1 conserved Plasmodium protein, unknown function [Plasmodium berghei ANKA]